MERQDRDVSHHRLAWLTIGAALVLDTLCGIAYGIAEHIGIWHGLYCALANAVTLGGDVSPVNTAGYVINTIECLTVVPLFAATFSLFTSALAAVHVRKSEAAIRNHMTQTLGGRQQ
jgi:hypothetical protein